jgi:hypothetical protein
MLTEEKLDTIHARFVASPRKSLKKLDQGDEYCEKNLHEEPQSCYRCNHKRQW